MHPWHFLISTSRYPSEAGIPERLVTGAFNLSVSAQSLKVGYADPEVIITYMPEYQDIQQQMAAEYRALCYQAFNVARYQLDQSSKILGGMQKQVIVVDIDENAGITTSDEIRNAGGEASFFKADVRLKRDMENIAGAAIEKYGRIDILISSAGIYSFARVEELSEEEDKSEEDKEQEENKGE